MGNRAVTQHPTPRPAAKPEIFQSNLTFIKEAPEQPIYGYGWGLIAAVTPMKRNPAAKKAQSAEAQSADSQVQAPGRAPCAPSGGAISQAAMVPAAAQNFVKRFGPDAPAEARKRAEELRQAGKIDDYNMWMLIYQQAKFLVETPGEGTKH